MLISMTGFAMRKVSSEIGDFTFIIKSFNHRFLDLSVNLPPEFMWWEIKIRRIIKRKLLRGYVNFHLKWEREKDEKELPNFQINEAVVCKYYESLKKIKERFHLPDDINLPLIVQFPNLFVSRGEVIEKEINTNLWPLVKKNLELILEDLVDTRKKEGRELQEDILYRINIIKRTLKDMKSHLPKVLKQYRKKLEERVFSSVNNPDKERIMQEVLFQAGKIDITEELIRTSSHLKMFASEIRKKKSSGKKMDFICQEILREINTMGSKMGNTEISTKIVDLKMELDKIREQLRNVE